VPTSRIPHVASAVDAFRVRPGQLDAGGCQPGFREGSRGRPGRPGDGGPRRAAGCGGPRPGHTVTGTSARIGDGLSTHHDEFILAASASATTSRSGHGRRPAPTHSVQIGLANLWQTAVAGPPGTQQAGHVPRLSCWFVVEPPAGIEPATPSLPWLTGNSSRHPRRAGFRERSPKIRSTPAGCARPAPW
jgi:hypothetical protein